MLTRIKINNFKRFESADVELGNPVVFIGPNNSGKTSVLQALALWDIGLRRWNEKRKGKDRPKKREGVAINRRDLVTVPVPGARQLWHNLGVRNIRREDGAQKTSNILIEIVVEGETDTIPWTCGFEFDYANDESFYCRPARVPGSTEERILVPDLIGGLQVALLPPMSGLSANETRLDVGAVNVRVGEGRTAEVLRNLCYRLHEENPELWQRLVERIQTLFGVEIQAPEYVKERGEIQMAYRDRGITLDMASSGRGMQQTLLLLSYLYSNPKAVLLLDEPDAHLEILRQRQIYDVLSEAAGTQGSQVIIASHSEVLLNEAAGRDVVVAFIGNPHRINDRGSQLLKSLNEIGFEHYYLAEQTGWVLYLEGSTDLASLQAFARILGKTDAAAALEKPFVHYVANNYDEVRRHFHGIKEAVPGLVGVALFDNLGGKHPADLGAAKLEWNRREIENYFTTPKVLDRYARSLAGSEAEGPLFESAAADRASRMMSESLAELSAALRTTEEIADPFSHSVKVSDTLLRPLFRLFFEKLGITNLMAKKNYHELASFLLPEEVAPEVAEKLDSIVATAKSAHPPKE